LEEAWTVLDNAIKKERDLLNFLTGLTVWVSFISPTSNLFPWNSRFQFDDQKNSASLIFVEINNFPEHLTPLDITFILCSLKRKRMRAALGNKNDTIISSEANLGG